MQFDPEELTISVGDTVTWTNNDGMSHTATSTDGPEAFDSGNIGSGNTWSFTFTEAGTYEYKCDYHSSMTATIIVNA
jgi:plastocyanin